MEVSEFETRGNQLPSGTPALGEDDAFDAIQISTPLKIHEYGPITSEDPVGGCGWVVAVPWTLAVIMPILTFFLTRKASRSGEKTKLIVEDVKQFMGKIEDIGPLACAHQSGSPVNELESLELSRKYLTELRKSASFIHLRIERTLKNEVDKSRWLTEYLRWKAELDGDSGLITNKKNKWSRDSVDRLEKFTAEYLAFICSTRNGIAINTIRTN